MKILAVRGRNLASLQREFAIDFELSPFDRHGLFAICGPTGSGKSTLLDAICLALFDRAPRFDGAPKVLVGDAAADDEGKVKSDDVRSILSRGQAEGYAEVDFRGVDGNSYRARWSVRRSRGRADGRFQSQVVSLHRLPEMQALGDTKTQTLAELEEKLGLSYEQFRRSVMLAQGDFAAFLRAGDDERGELLERMTGTELYSRLSIGAYRRSKLEDERLQRLEALREESERGVLSAGELQLLRASVAEGERQLETLERQVEGARSAMRWYEEQSALADAERAAGDRLAAIVERWSAGDARRREIELTLRIWPLDEAFARRESLVGQIRDSDTLRSETDTALELTRRAIEAARQEQEKRVADLDRIAEQHRALDPICERARGLERQRAAVGEAIRGLEQNLQRISTALDEVSRLLTELDLAIVEIATEQRELRAWFEARPTAIQQHARGASIREQIVRFAEAKQEMAQREATLTMLRQTLQGLEQALEDRRASVSELAQRKQALADALLPLESGDDLDPATVALSIAEARQRLVGFERAAKELVSLRAAWPLFDTATVALDEAKRTVVESERNLAERELALSDCEERAGEMRRAYERALGVAEVAAHRHLLRDGEPCPLCGALDHPDSGLPAEDGALAASQQQAQEAATVAASLRAERTAALEMRDSARAMRDRAARERELLAADLARPLASLVEFAKALEIPCPLLVSSLGPDRPTFEQLEDELSALSSALDQSRTTARARLVEHERQAQGLAERAREQQRIASDARRVDEELARFRQALSHLEAERSDELRRYNEIQQTRASQESARDEIVRDLSGWFPAAVEQQRLIADPNGFGRTFDEALRETEAMIARSSRLDAKLEELGRERERRGSEVQTLAREHQLASRSRDQSVSELARIRSQHAKLLFGCDADEIASALEGRRVWLRDELERQRLVLVPLERDASILGERRETAQRRSDELRQELERIRASIDARLVDAAVTEDAARRLLSVDRAALDAESETWSRLETELKGARAVFEDRRRLRRAHAEHAPPALAEIEARAILRDGEERRKGLREELVRAESRLAVDGRGRTRVAELAPEIEAQGERTRLWRQMRDLIGSADGKRFRVFAQSLTLDALVAEANLHLDELARRYRLMRVPRSAMALQVIDRDMGDEIRSTASLSGGESFLVSLSLALALSSLGGARSGVESLFIDEGFGTLDADTLDVALSALDALQSAGRQIGVISHVESFTDRFAARVVIRPEGAGQSRVAVEGSAVALPTADAPNLD
ncbi:MAG: AAA family ATPase [Myxococcales bacterium]|nr:AAA family ATPase [Myxococcales bacterium]